MVAKPFRVPLLGQAANWLGRGSQVDIHSVTTPCMMLWGDRDRSHRKTYPRSLHACAPHAEIVRFPKLDHFPDLEQPSDYAELFVAHVARHWAS